MTRDFTYAALGVLCTAAFDMAADELRQSITRASIDPDAPIGSGPSFPDNPATI